MKKKVTVILTSLLLLTTLAACGQDKTATNKSDDAATKSSQTSKQTSQKAKSSSSSRHSQATRQSSDKTTSAAPTTPMNFNQIKAGNFSSLVGNWAQIGTGYNRHDAHGMRYKAGGDGQLAVSKSTMTTGTNGITMHGNTITDNDGDHPLTYRVNNKALVASLKNEDVAINWSVTFYPKGTTSEYRDDSHASKNTKNLIVVWTSNNSYTQIFAQEKTTSQADTSKLDIEQLQADHFSILVGRWKNSAGKVIEITDRVANKPADSSLAADKGAIVRGKDHDGSPEIVVTGKISDGYIAGGIGHFNEQALTPLAIIPRGVKASDDDDSNVNQDRLIFGGGQAGYASQAYYRESK